MSLGILPVSQTSIRTQIYPRDGELNSFKEVKRHEVPFTQVLTNGVSTTLLLHVKLCISRTMYHTCVVYEQ